MNLGMNNMKLRQYLMIKQAGTLSFDDKPEELKPVDPMIYLGNSPLQKHDDSITPVGRHYTDLADKAAEPGRYLPLRRGRFSENTMVAPDYQKQLDKADKTLNRIQTDKSREFSDRMKKNRMSYLKAMLAGAGMFGGGSMLMNMGTPVARPGLYHGGMAAAGALSGLLTAALYNRGLEKHEGRSPLQRLWRNVVTRPIDYFKNIGKAPATEEDWANLNKMDAERQLGNQ